MDQTPVATKEKWYCKSNCTALLSVISMVLATAAVIGTGLILGKK